MKASSYLASSGGPVLRQFWEDFGALHPTHPILLEILQDRVDPELLVPLAVGRHYRKSEIMVLQFQSCLGLGSRQSTGQKACKKRKFHDRGSANVPERTTAQINMLGHSFGAVLLD